MEKKTKIALETMFRNYKKNKETLIKQEGLNDLISRQVSGTDYGKVLVQSSPKNNLEEGIIKVVDDMERVARWVKVVDYTLIKYRGEHKDKLIECLYFKCFSITKTARVLHIDRKTVFRWKDEILASAELYAKDLRVWR